MHDKDLRWFLDVSVRTPMPVLLDRMRECSWMVQTIEDEVKIEIATLEELIRAHDASEHWVIELSSIDAEMKCIETQHRLKKMGFGVVEKLIRQDRRGIGSTFGLRDLVLGIYRRHIARCQMFMRCIEDLRERTMVLAENIKSQQLSSNDL